MMIASDKKNILIGVCGSIAAYKSLVLVRLFIKAGYNVKVIMTKAAEDFVSALSFSTLSKHAVFSDISNGDEWNNHVELGLWADFMIIAPATANTLGKMANGIADNMLLASYLSAKCPVFIAPAMDLDMWRHPSTQNNIQKLKSFGNTIIQPTSGELASGLIGEGRMEEPEQIFSLINALNAQSKPLQGKTILITAGPTYEAIDPVRFIGNRSSGKMGVALAEEAVKLGAKVKLVIGPNHLDISNEISVINIVSAEEMYTHCVDIFTKVDYAIMAAAVADFTPSTKSAQKIKKKGSEGMALNLVRTKDIAASLGKVKQKNQILVGFALETQKEQENALRKLEKKNFDFIVLNSLNDAGAGFAVDSNKISIIAGRNKITKFELKSKKEVARDILTYLVEYKSNA